MSVFAAKFGVVGKRLPIKPNAFPVHPLPREEGLLHSLSHLMRRVTNEAVLYAVRVAIGSGDFTLRINVEDGRERRSGHIDRDIDAIDQDPAVLVEIGIEV